MFRLSSGVDTKQARVRNPAPYLLFSDYMHQHLRGSRNKLEMFNGLLGRVAQACIRAERLLESKVELLHRVHVAAHLQGDTLPACVQADSIGASADGCRLCVEADRHAKADPMPRARESGEEGANRKRMDGDCPRCSPW